ncbi:hypothetical protein J4G08_01210 [Candidatus Poribacteria bacterium]|nr:hypothetical protein [Candidatus Poribacteria bacterium]
MKQSAFITTLFLFFVSVVLADTSEEHQDCPAPISVIGNHVHTSGEMMFSCLQSGTDTVETADVLNVFEKSFEPTESGRHSDDSPDGLWWVFLCFRF